MPSRLRPSFAPLLTFAGVALLGARCGDEPTAADALAVHERWYQAQPGSASAQPAVTGDLVVFGTGDGQLVARDRATGLIRWTGRVATAGPVDGASLIAVGGVVVAPVINSVMALDAKTGQERWRYAPPPDTINADGQPGPGQVVNAHVGADSGTVYLPAWGASISALDVRTGVVRWTWTPGRTETDTAASGMFRSGVSGVRVSGDTVIGAAWHFRDRLGITSEAWVVAVDARTGRTLWRVALPSVENGTATWAQPALWRQLVLVTTLSGHLVALDRTRQQVAWDIPPQAPDAGESRSATVASPVVFDDVIYHDGGNQYLYARRASDGTLLWKSRIDGMFFHDMAVSATRIYGGDPGVLSIFDRQSGRRLGRLTQPHVSDESRTRIASTPIVANGQVFLAVLGAAWSFDEP